MLVKLYFELRSRARNAFLKKEIKIVYLGNCKEIRLWIMTMDLAMLEISFFFAKNMKVKPPSKIALFYWHLIIN